MFFHLSQVIFLKITCELLYNYMGFWKDMLCFMYKYTAVKFYFCLFVSCVRKQILSFYRILFLFLIILLAK